MIKEKAVQFAGREPGYANVEIDLRQHNCEITKLDCQHFAVPAGILGQLVVGDHVGALLGVAQMRDHNHWHFGASKQPRRL